MKNIELIIRASDYRRDIDPILVYALNAEKHYTYENE